MSSSILQILAKESVQKSNNPASYWGQNSHYGFKNSLRSLESSEVCDILLAMNDTVLLTLEMPGSVFSALRQEPEAFLHEMRLAAAAKWYETGQVSQSKAAEIAGLSRAEFLTALSRFAVSPFQTSAENLIQESR